MKGAFAVQKSWVRKSVFRAIPLMLVVYFVAAISPLPELIGRNNPSFAARLSPPFFNFSAYYSEGQVMGFTLGASQREAAKVVSDKYLGAVIFLNGCGSGAPRRPYSLSFDNEEQFWEWAQRKIVWCLRNKEKDFSLHFDFENDKLNQIRVIVTNFEGT